MIFFRHVAFYAILIVFACAFVSNISAPPLYAKESQTARKFKEKRLIKRERYKKKKGTTKAKAYVKAFSPVYAYIVVDAASGRVLRSFNADVKTPPASLTKMMTAYLAFEALEVRKIKFDQNLWVSSNAAKQIPGKLWLKKGDSISVKDALYSSIIKSHNDAAVVLGEAIGGTENNFAYLMTRKARQLGMYKTFFYNAAGVPHLSQTTTARDMMILARALYKRFPQHYHIFGQKTFTYGTRTFPNSNKLLGVVEGVDGLKTGYTCRSGFNLAVSAERGGIRLIAVVLGGKTRLWRDQQMTQLINITFKSLESAGPLYPVPIVKPPLSEIVSAQAPDTAKLLNKGNQPLPLSQGGKGISPPFSPPVSLKPSAPAQPINSAVSKVQDRTLSSPYPENQEDSSSLSNQAEEDSRELQEWEEFHKSPEKSGVKEKEQESVDQEQEIESLSRNQLSSVRLKPLPVVKELQLPDPELLQEEMGDFEERKGEYPAAEPTSESEKLMPLKENPAKAKPREGTMPKIPFKEILENKITSRDWSIQVGSYKSAKSAYEKVQELMEEFKLPGKTFIKRTGKQPKISYEGFIKDLSQAQAQQIFAILKKNNAECVLTPPPSLKAKKN